MAFRQAGDKLPTIVEQVDGRHTSARKLRLTPAVKEQLQVESSSTSTSSLYCCTVHSYPLLDNPATGSVTECPKNLSEYPENLSVMNGKSPPVGKMHYTHNLLRQLPTNNPSAINSAILVMSKS